MKKYKIYAAHSMEGLTPDKSVLRPEALQRIVQSLSPDRFEVIIPELLEAKETFDKIYKRDINELKRCDIVVVDLYNHGLLSSEGRTKLDDMVAKNDIDIECLFRKCTIQCRGTIEEAGHAKALGKYVVEITRNPKHYHPFCLGGDYIASGIEDAAEHIVKKFGGRKCQ